MRITLQWNLEDTRIANYWVAQVFIYRVVQIKKSPNDGLRQLVYFYYPQLTL